MINTTDTQRQTEYKLDYKVGSFNILYEDKWFLEVCLSRTAPRSAQFMPRQMVGYSEDMVVCSMANKSLPGPSHLWEMFCRTEFWQTTCASPACLREAAELGRAKARAAVPPDGASGAPSPLSADKLHSCGVTCQHLQCGSPETNQECSACQTVALSHYIETTFLSEPWALSEQEWGIHWRSDLQPCNHRQPSAARPALQLKEKKSCKSVPNPCSICCVDTTVVSNNSHGI